MNAYSICEVAICLHALKGKGCRIKKTLRVCACFIWNHGPRNNTVLEGDLDAHPDLPLHWMLGTDF